mmetsp:Transcript_4155/g.6260  ORF Transcript_4155/g.6260 Transcript_4155/m.6260 type:complete len:218 (+) Transcript_4155:22-675(+)
MSTYRIDPESQLTARPNLSPCCMSQTDLQQMIPKFPETFPLVLDDLVDRRRYREMIEFANQTMIDEFTPVLEEITSGSMWWFIPISILTCGIGGIIFMMTRMRKMQTMVAQSMENFTNKVESEGRRLFNEDEYQWMVRRERVLVVNSNNTTSHSEQAYLLLQIAPKVYKANDMQVPNNTTMQSSGASSQGYTGTIDQYSQKTPLMQKQPSAPYYTAK